MLFQCYLGLPILQKSFGTTMVQADVSLCDVL